MQEERAVVAQEKPDIEDKVNKDKVPSNASEGLRRQARSSTRSSIKQFYLGTFIIYMVCILVQVNTIY